MRIVLIFEGTENSNKNPSIMTDLANMLESCKRGGQNVEYRLMSGSGTHGCCLRRKLSARYGCDSKAIVLDQYKWLTDYVNSNHLLPKDQEIYVFGFSRGAYQAARIVELLKARGIPSDARNCKGEMREFVKSPFSVCAHSLENGRVPKIEYVGLIDMVKSTRLDGFSSIPTFIPDGIHCRHALAIHEVRKYFKPEILPKSVHSRIEEKWFLGVHSDLGRGYRSKESGWFKRKCRAFTKWRFHKSCHRIGIYTGETNYNVKDVDTKMLPHIVISWITSQVPFLSVAPIQNSLADILMLANNFPFIIHNSFLDVTNLFGVFKPRVRKYSRADTHISVKMLNDLFLAFPNLYPRVYRRSLYKSFHDLGEGWTPILVHKSERKLIAQLANGSHLGPINAFLIAHGYIGGTANPFS